MPRAKTIKKAGSDKESTPKKSKAARRAPREYSATESYDEGEVIFHKIWDDTGEILEVGTTEDGIRKIRVAFEKVGVKNLKIG